MQSSNLSRVSERGQFLRDAALGALLSLFIFMPTSAAGVGFHGYSYAREATGGAGFTGVSLTRNDSIITGIPATGCSVPYTGDPVYQTMWVLWGDGQQWRELGTGHQCAQNFVYWYWGFAVGGTWNPIAYQGGVGTNQSHDFMMRRLNGTNVQWMVDGVIKGAQTSTWPGAVRVEAGIESYAATASVYYGNFALAAQRNDGAFNPWAGRDFAEKIGAIMCGKWTADTTYRSGINAC